MQFFASCNKSVKNETQKDVSVNTILKVKNDSTGCYIQIKNENLKQAIKLFTKEEFSRRNGFGVLTLRVYNDESLRKFYGLSELTSDVEFKGFKPVCYSMVDSNLVLIKIDAVNSILKSLDLSEVNTNHIEKINSMRSSRYPFWMIEERNDSIVILEKRTN